MVTVNKTEYLDEQGLKDLWEKIKSYVAENSGSGGTIDLDGYTTVEELNTALSSYYNKEELDAMFNALNIPSLDGYATETYVQEQISAIDIPTVPTKVSEFENDKGYLTEHQSLDNYYNKTEVDTKIANISTGGTVSLENYYTKQEVDAKIPDTSGFLTEIPNTYALKTDIPATPDLTPYALKTEIPTIPTNVSSFTNDSGYLTEHQSLSAYALKSELPIVPDMTEYSKTTEIQTMIAEAIGGIENGTY